MVAHATKKLYLKYMDTQGVDTTQFRLSTIRYVLKNNIESNYRPFFRGNVGLHLTYLLLLVKTGSVYIAHSSSR